MTEEAAKELAAAMNRLADAMNNFNRQSYQPYPVPLPNPMWGAPDWTYRPRTVWCGPYGPAIAYTGGVQ